MAAQACLQAGIYFRINEEVITTRNKRIKYALLSALLLLLEVLIALYVHDNFIRPYIGDVLVVILIYCVVRIFIPEKVRLLPVYVFIFACFTEFMQYLNIVEVLGLQDNKFFNILIGTVFDWSDIISYGAGCILLGIYEMMRNKSGSAGI